MSDQSDTDVAGDGNGDRTGDDAPAGGGPFSPGWGTPSVRRVFDVLLVVALVLVVVPFAVYAVPSLVGAEDSYIVRSGSMAPVIETGDVVIVEQTTPAAVESGDVITFLPDGQPPPTTHRVVSKTETDGVIRFTTKGDANDQPDAEPVVENELVGEVTLVLPYVGYVVSFASTSAGFFALVAAPFGLLVATEVWSVFREGRDGDEETDPEDSSTPGPTATSTADTAADAPEAYTLSPTDLRLSLAILLALTVYSSFVAYSRPTPWSIAVAVGAFGTAVYLAAMRYTAAAAPDSGGPAAPAPLHAREGAPPGGDSGHVVEAPDDVLGPDRLLPVSLRMSPAVTTRSGNGHLDRISGEAGIRDGPDGPAADATDATDGPGPEAEADAEADADDDAAAAAPEDDGTGRFGRPTLSAVGRPVVRFLYAVGYVEVTAARAVLRRLGLRATDDGGED